MGVHADEFGSTNWSLIHAAMGDSPRAQDAMAKLSARYWYPLYAYLKRQATTRERADDLTQEFFARQFVTGEVLEGVHPGKGRFRAWLLVCLQNHVKNEHERDTAQKRGGANPHVSLDEFGSAENLYRAAPPDLSAEQLYDQSWGLTLLARAYEALRVKKENSPGAARYRVLAPFLPGGAGGDRTRAAEQLELDNNAFKQALDRLRKELGEAIRAEVASTVSDPSDLDAELRYLMEVCSW